jgi:SAM-dependent methyltransferase
MREISARTALNWSWGDPVRATLLQKEILAQKELLRDWYEKIYRFAAAHCAPGRHNLELGSGSSFLYIKIKGLITSNIIAIPGNQVAFDACTLPFRDGSLDNIILISVLHHLNDPVRFLKEARRVLAHGGRVILSDPYISPVSYLIWKYLHHENCDMKAIGFTHSTGNPLRDANSASATLLFSKKLFPEFNPGFTILKTVYHSKFEYWLAGGYNFGHLFPPKLKGLISLAENCLSFLDKFMASFMFVVLEKT